ncbi:hypothetical protein AAG570_013767 [Ranatra chinensis]|uniref:Uncharacterized protein n=1 Tax=Ranatra chinensis TaxID=642074 RepID=A0ABD0YVN0_9HEMI
MAAEKNVLQSERPVGDGRILPSPITMIAKYYAENLTDIGKAVGSKQFGQIKEKLAPVTLSRGVTPGYRGSQFHKDPKEGAAAWPALYQVRLFVRQSSHTDGNCLQHRAVGNPAEPFRIADTQLHRSSSFNSSGRSSNCDTADDVYSDVSLEEDVLDLNHKVRNV